MTGAALERSTFTPALMLMSGRAAGFALTFIVPVLLARLFSPAEFGTYKQFFVVVYTTYAIGQIGMAESLYYFLPSSGAKSGRYVCNSALMLGLVGVAVCAGLTAFSGRIADWLSNPALNDLLWAAGLYLLLMLTSSVLEIVWISRKRYRRATLSYALSDFTRAALLILPAVIYRSIEAALLGGLLFCLARATATAAVIRGEFRGELRPDWSLMRSQLVYAIPFAVAVVVEVAQTNYHQLAVSYHFDAATFAIYAVGCLQIPLVEYMANAASNVMMVRMREEIQDGRRDALLPIWRDTTRRLALVFFPAVALLAVSSHSLITVLFTTRYADSAPVFMAWSASIAFAAFQSDGVMRVLAQTRFLLLVNATRLALIVAAMNWFIARFHLVGAVMLTLSGMLLAKTMALVRMRMLFQTDFPSLLPWNDLGRILLASLLSAAPAALLNATSEWNPVLLLLAGGTLYAATYGALLRLFGILTESERRIIGGWFAGWRRCAE